LRVGGQALPFGPSLAIGVIITVLLWPGISRNAHILFDPLFLGVMGIGGAVSMVVLAFLFRLWALLMRMMDGHGHNGSNRCSGS
jgi:hypothetical protein